ncbi:MAG TPA: hypothetical protein VGE06_11975 [Flavisolibacter sp.]
MKPKKVNPSTNKEDYLLPGWLSYAILILALAWFVLQVFRPAGPPRTDFPSHVPPTPK